MLSKSRQQEVKENFRKAKYSSLHQCYVNPSRNKIRSYELIIDKMHYDNGFNLRILGFNSMTYSCAYLYEDKEDGNIKIKYFTHMNTYDFDY